jgi:hypothetical protein
VLTVLSRLRQNFIAAPIGINGWADPEPPLLLFSLTVAGNTLGAGRRGIALDTLVAHVGDTEIVDNLVLGPSDAGISLTGVKMPSALVSVDGNELGVSGNGLVVGTSGVAITDNTVTGTWTDERDATDLHGVRIEASAVPVESGTTTRVDNNRIAGFGGRGMLLEGLVSNAEVAHNEVYDCGSGISVTFKTPRRLVHVTDNVVHDVGVRFAEGDETFALGIWVAGAEKCLVGHNTVHRVGEASEATQYAVGIATLGVLEARWIGNSVTDVGSIANPGFAMDYSAVAVLQFTMEANRCTRRPEFDKLEDFRGGGLMLKGLDLDRRRLRDTGRAGKPFEAGFADAGAAYYLASSSFVMHFLLAGRPSALIGSNNFTGTPLSNAVDIEFPGTVIFGQNQCSHSSRTDQPTVRIAADAAAVTANHVVGGQPSMRLEVNPERLTAVGNLTSAGISPPLSPVFEPLNLDGVV